MIGDEQVFLEIYLKESAAGDEKLRDAKGARLGQFREMVSGARAILTEATHPSGRQSPLAMDAATFRALGHRLVDQLAEFLESCHAVP